MDLLTAIRDENLFQPWFRDPGSWVAWRAFIGGVFGLPLTEEEAAVFTRCTARARPPTAQASEAWVVAGRRSGKSFILSLIAVYLATFKDWRPYLAPGERATVMVLATDKRQARVIMRYVEALLTGIPMLKALIEHQRSSRVDDTSFDLEGRVTVEVHTANFRSVRGYTICAALLDELAFWKDETSASPDVEVIEAIRPALATVEGSMLLAASSPYSRRGALWQTHRRHYAQDSSVLVWQAPTGVMNPTVPQRVIDEAFERDPAVASSEWNAEFRSDLESFVDRAAVEACIEPDCRERPRIAGVNYFSFIDPSGGRNDSMTLAIAHREGNVGVLDCLRERIPPFDPIEVTREFSATMLTYGVHFAHADRYGGEYATTSFREHGVTLRPSTRSKSILYSELLPVINSRRALLLDNPKLLTQLVSLERRVGRGRDSIDHPPGAHDDVANACAGVLVESAGAALMRLPLVW